MCTHCARICEVDWIVPVHIESQQFHSGGGFSNHSIIIKCTVMNKILLL